jgi:hypothetical protein
LAVEDRVSPVAGAVTVTFAPRIADPVESVIVPEMLPVVCPKRSGLAATARKPTRARPTVFVILVKLRPDKSCNALSVVI